MFLRPLGWRFGGPGLTFWRPGVGVSAAGSWHFGDLFQLVELLRPIKTWRKNANPQVAEMSNPWVAETSTQGHYFGIVFFKFLVTGIELG